VNIKTDLYNACVKLVDKRFENIQNNILELHNNLLSETKSSAGDKHETGRAMMQLERERFGVQLSEINKLRTALDKINIENKLNHVCVGTIVFTSQNNYFIAVSLGAIEINGKLFYAISPQTPIGRLLMGKSIGDSINFNGNIIRIKRIE
jgi:hypothetical protein